MSPEKIGKYKITKFPKARIPTLDFLELGDKNHYVKSLIDVDVTKGRQNIITYEQNNGVKLSFTAWLLKCIANAANEYNAVHSMMLGKKKIIIFDDVDISITVEKSIKGIKVPMPLVVRKTNEKNLLQIHEEIRGAQNEDLNGATVLGESKLDRKMKIYTSMPKFIRKFMIRNIIKDPFKVKQLMGTIIVTSIGMFGKVNGWPIPTTAHPLAFAIGGITKKAGVINNNIEIREFLSITILFNHDVVDGAPATRFVSRLVELIESGFGI
ncbi:2-oxo acid dehydrogenase subunit E2 [Promethearchaeum syntrophicum]|uniref:2-oxo acid dehydrogenase subunit E2 n=1 Tax=Promethearchaeum syntrophicum TaxID=2594042 RepID=A0A5B9DF66_9ARCH|nr:2-oxo acid dehydrogenase subunit E2 [Candidatus Prometheoarchaeum syntrophicum]QEE17979.1 branched-chain alpha-keto acid dehydrogenase subunit E2 [Candidatus Prometheoarchaeum syntrophicum]